MEKFSYKIPLQNRESLIRLGILAFQMLQLAFYLIVLLQVTSPGPALDDAWIHCQFATNIARYGELSFNPGKWTIGTTSLLWDIILSSGIVLGIPIIYFGLGLEIALYLVLGQLIYTIFRDYWREEFQYALFGLILVILTGCLTWFSLSGMETVLMLVLGCWWILAFSKDKYWLSGLITGILMLTRIEGALFLIMGIFFALYQSGWKKGSRTIGKLLLFSLPLVLPSIILNLSVAGEFYPPTMGGKKWLYDFQNTFFNHSPRRVMNYIISWIAVFHQSVFWPEQAHLPLTLSFRIISVLSPGRFGAKVHQFAYEPAPLILQIGLFLIWTILMVIMFQGAFIALKLIWQNFRAKAKLKGWEYLTLWMLGQNLLYIIVMPTRGQGGRYQAVNFILAGLFLSIGVWKGGLLKKVRVGIGKYLITALILLIYVASNISWAKVYADTVLLVNNVHCQAGRWLHNNLPAGTNIAAFDVGAIRYYSELPVTDIAGLTDNEALKYVYAGKVVDLMRKENSQYFVMVENYEKPTFIGKGKRITQNYNLYERMGIFKEIDRSIDLVPVVEFSVPFEVHYRAYKLLHHHGPIIRIFKIIWLEHPED